MCGIAGYIGPRPLPEERLQHCLRLMHRRGPDANGIFSEEVPKGRWVHLLHSRLSIIDLRERANQPFHFNSNVLAFNGELYNYVEQRDVLRDNGYAIETSSDTEVLAKLLDWRGLHALDLCEGMWALAFLDRRSGRLILSRDRFGEKPLYVLRDGDSFYFGSEPKFIVALRGRALKVNRQHVRRFLVLGYKSLYKQREQFFEELDEVPSAGALLIEPHGEERQVTYWKPAPGEEPGMGWDEAVAGVRERLIDSVRLRLRADVSLAFCMSGGVDSNSIIATARRELGYDVHGFTIGNTDERYAEDELVQESVSELGIRHTTVPMKTSDFVSNLHTLVQQHDAPVYTISYYAHWLLQQSINDHGYRISVSGTGADELVTGYYDHHLFYLAELQSQPDELAAATQNWLRHVKPIVRNPMLQDPNRFVTAPRNRAHIYLRAEEFAGWLRQPFAEDFVEESYTGSLLRNRMLNEMFVESVPVILHEDDLNAMYFSIENRSPFLDRRLFEFCLQIPSRLLIRDGYAKAVLREAVKGIVPERVRTNRVKVGFNAPILSFLDTHDSSVRDFLLDDSPIFELVHRQRIEELLEKSSFPNSESKFLFYFVASKVFLDIFEKAP